MYYPKMFSYIKDIATNKVRIFRIFPMIIAIPKIFEFFVYRIKFVYYFKKNIFKIIDKKFCSTNYYAYLCIKIIERQTS